MISCKAMVMIFTESYAYTGEGRRQFTGGRVAVDLGLCRSTIDQYDGGLSEKAVSWRAWGG